MASVPLIAVTGTLDLGDSGSGSVARKVIELTVGSLVGSFVVQGRLAGQGGTFVAIPYKSRYVNGAVGTEAFVTTALTGNSIIEVNSTGIEVRLAYTHTSGTVGTGTLKFLDLIG